MSRPPRAPAKAVIEVRGLCNRFGKQSVHENLDLDVYQGEILGAVSYTHLTLPTILLV